MCDSFQDPSRLHEEAVSKIFQQDLTKSYEEVVPESWEDILPNDASNKASIADLSEEQQIEYDEFLREMAGSWQAPDSDDEEGDEEEEEEETEETEGINDQEYAAFLRDFAGSWEAPPTEDSDEEEDDWVHVDGDSHDAVDSDKDELAGNDASSSKKSTCTTTCSTRTPSVAGSDQPSEEEKEAQVDDNGWGHLACYGEDLTLAQKEKELADAKKLLEETEAEKAAILAYLESIKAGCDFMEENFETRESRRAAETDALTKAEELIKGTPAYEAAVAAQDLEDLGSCKDICTENPREHVKCKACLAKGRVRQSVLH